MPWWPHQLAVSGLPSGRRRQNCAGAGRPRGEDQLCFRLFLHLSCHPGPSGGILSWAEGMCPEPVLRAATSNHAAPGQLLLPRPSPPRPHQLFPRPRQQTWARTVTRNPCHLAS